MSTQKATYPLHKGYQCLRLYREIMKLHLQKMPEELRNFGDLYIKQEFRLHLDKSTDDQIDKFIAGWQKYKGDLELMDFRNRRAVKESIFDPRLDEMIKDKLSEEQANALKSFKDTIYEG